MLVNIGIGHREVFCGGGGEGMRLGRLSNPEVANSGRTERDSGGVRHGLRYYGLRVIGLIQFALLADTLLTGSRWLIAHEA